MSAASSKVRRGPLLLLLIALLLAGGLIDRRARASSSDTTATTVAPMPAAAPPSARSSAWYCTGVNAQANTPADGSVVVANTGDRNLTGTLTILPSEGQPKVVALEIGTGSRRTVRLSEVAPALFASAVVELDGGGAVAEVTTTGPLGDSVGQCASQASDRWYFADGVTTRDASETLVLFNPFPDDAVVDLIFTTDEGQVRPESLTGLSVRGRSNAAIAVGDHVQRREAVATAITARSGRLIASRIQAFDGSVGRKGVSVTLGAAAPSDVWYFPEGQVSERLVEQYHLFNPNRAEARVELDFYLSQGAAEPMLITVPGESRVTVKANDEPRIPKNVSHALTVRGLTPAQVVAERTISGQAERRNGVAMTVGARSAALRWGLAAGQADSAVEEWLIFQNPGDAAARVSVSLLADGRRQPVEGMVDLEVPASGRLGVRVNDSLNRDATPMVIEASRPVVVERDLYRTRGTGMAMSIATLLRD